MSAPEELSFDKILQFMLQNGGRVTNHELVKHFKVFLTDPANRAEAREIFKKHVNTLASIKNQNNEKWLILKRKYMVTNKIDPLDVSCDSEPASDPPELETTMLSPRPVPPLDHTPRAPPPYKMPPEFSPKIMSPDRNLIEPPTFPLPTYANNTSRPKSLVSEAMNEMKENEPPSKIDDIKQNFTICENFTNETKCYDKRSESPCDLRRSISAQENLANVADNIVELRRDSTPTLMASEHNVLVKERKKIFNKNNGEGDIVKTRPLATRKNAQRVDNQKRSSVMPHLDPKGHEWIVRASAGDYEALSRMIAANPNLVRLKDPSTTALHWACKRGDERLVKMLATMAPAAINERTNGGYTPLHIAMQFRHENIYKLLVGVFDANPTLADWSGRKPRQYPVNADTWSPGKKAAKKQSEKDLGFLRIGSLNLRVKKTTVAFGNFLGVGVARTPSNAGACAPAQRISAPQQARARRQPPELDHLKSWGSADNITKEAKMPPPAQARAKRRAGGAGAARGGDAQSRSTPSTPNQPRAPLALGAGGGDSDSDSAAGFHAAWQLERNTHM